MKILKGICALAVLAALLVGIAPQTGICQMTPLRAFACAMPCCKTPAKAASCPMIRPVAPRDIIGTSSLKVSPVLKVVAAVAFRDFLAPYNQVSKIYQQPQVPRTFFYSTPQIGPAPPVLA